MSKPALQVRIRADKTGPRPPEGQPWPCAGVEIELPPGDEVELPTSWIERYIDSDWMEVHTTGVVERPSRPNPGVDRKGSTTVAEDHRLSVDGMPSPHVFRHVNKIVLHTLNQGDITLKVTRQPDKYVDSDDPTEKVTPEVYAEGRTRVDSFYTCQIQSTED